MLDEIRVLEKMPLFSGLSAKELEKVAGILHLTDVKKDQMMTVIGKPAINFFIVYKGKYRVTFADGKSVTLDRRGDFMGWASMVGDPEYIGDGVALTDGEMFKVSRDDFLALLVSDASIGNRVMANGSDLAAKGKPFD